MEGKETTHFAEMPLIEGKPALQWIGNALDKLRLTIVLRRNFCDPTLELDVLRGMLCAHAAMPLVFGDGLYRGRYVLIGITTRTTQTGPDGTAVGLDLEATLKEHVEPMKPGEIPNLPAVAGKARPEAQKAAATTVKIETNPDGFPVNKIVRTP